MKRCTKCVLPETFPGISFSEDGVCSICQEFDARETQLGVAPHMRDSLDELVESARAKGGRYHALVAFSGGKDSTYLAHIAKEKLGLEVLALTFDNGFVSAAANANMHKVVATMGIDHLTIRYRQDHMNAIYMESGLSPIYPDHLTKFGSGVCISCIRMVMTATLRTAIEKGIPMVLLGNSPGQLLQSDDELIFRDNRIPFGLRRHLFSRLAERLGEWVYDYVMLSADEYKTDPFPYMVSPLPILGYDEAEIYRTIGRLGWSKPTDVDPNSTNCRLNAFGIIRHKNRYRFHPYDYEMSQLVRLGSMSREVALTKLEDPEDSVYTIATGVERELFCGSCTKQCGV